MLASTWSTLLKCSCPLKGDRRKNERAITFGVLDICNHKSGKFITYYLLEDATELFFLVIYHIHWLLMMDESKQIGCKQVTLLFWNKYINQLLIILGTEVWQINDCVLSGQPVSSVKKHRFMVSRFSSLLHALHCNLLSYSAIYYCNIYSRKNFLYYDSYNW